MNVCQNDVRLNLSKEVSWTQLAVTHFASTVWRLVKLPGDGSEDVTSRDVVLRNRRATLQRISLIRCNVPRRLGSTMSPSKWRIYADPELWLLISWICGGSLCKQRARLSTADTIQPTDKTSCLKKFKRLSYMASAFGDLRKATNISWVTSVRYNCCVNGTC